MSKYDELIQAFDEFRRERDYWERKSNDGFYDPVGNVEERAKALIASAEKRLDKAFGALFTDHLDKTLNDLFQEWRTKADRLRS